MKFVAVILIVAVGSLTPAVSQTSTKFAAKSKSYDQCYKDCTATGSKAKNCATRCANKG